MSRSPIDQGPDGSTEEPANRSEPDDALVGTVSVGTRAYDVATSSNVDQTYVLTADSVKVISRLHHIVSTFPVGPRGKGVIPGDDGTHVYVTGYDGAMTIIATADNSARSLVVDRSIAEVVSTDGQRMYLAHNGTVGDERGTWISIIGSDGTVIALDTVDNSIVATAKVHSQPGAVALSADDQLPYVTDYWNGTVSVISTALMKPGAEGRD